MCVVGGPGERPDRRLSWSNPSRLSRLRWGRCRRVSHGHSWGCPGSRERRASALQRRVACEPDSRDAARSNPGVAKAASINGVGRLSELRDDGISDASIAIASPPAHPRSALATARAARKAYKSAGIIWPPCAWRPAIRSVSTIAAAPRRCLQPTAAYGSRHHRAGRKTGRDPRARPGANRSRRYRAGSSRERARLSEPLRRAGAPAVCVPDASGRASRSQHPGRNVGVPVGEGAIWLPITRGPAPGSWIFELLLLGWFASGC
jgi:hypothetical protein